MGGSTPCVCHSKDQYNSQKAIKVVILLTSSTVAPIVLLYHVLNCLHPHYALVHFDLPFREGTENDFVIFFGELIFNDILRPATSLVHP